MPRYNIDNPLTDDGRNKMNSMFEELYNEYISSGIDASTAKALAEEAVKNIDYAQTQLEQIRTDRLGRTFPTASSTVRAIQNGVDVLKESDGENLYYLESDFVADKFINLNGDIQNGVGWGYARTVVLPNTPYRIWLPTGDYSGRIGAIGFFDIDMVSTGYEYDNKNYKGEYQGIRYIEITTPPNTKYLCTTILRPDTQTQPFDARKTYKLFKGNINEPKITGVFGLEIVDKVGRENFNSFKEETDTKLTPDGGNLYVYPDQYTPDKFYNVSGGISTMVGWGMATVPIKPLNQYSLWLYTGDYSGTIGAIAWLDENKTTIGFLYDPKSYGGQFQGVNYLTVKSPENAKFIGITVVRSGDKAFDAKESFIIVEGNNLNDTNVIPYISKIGNIPIKTNILPYKDVKYVAFGDSLTEKNSRTSKNYQDYIADELGFEVVNMGVGGTGYKREESTSRAFYQRILDVPTDAQIITIFGSGNDLSTATGVNYTIGDPSDTGTDTICGCINTTIDRLFSVNPTIALGIITPTPWDGYPPYNEGNRMDLYSTAIVAICKRRSIPCLDLYHQSNLRPWDAEFRALYYSKDDGNGVHPDEKGHKRIANQVREFVKTLV